MGVGAAGSFGRFLLSRQMAVAYGQQAYAPQPHTPDPNPNDNLRVLVRILRLVLFLVLRRRVGAGNGWVDAEIAILA